MPLGFWLVVQLIVFITADHCTYERQDVFFVFALSLVLRFDGF